MNTETDNNRLFGSSGERSSYLDYLPPIYEEDPFLGRFLLAFERILAPLEQIVDNFDLYLAPNTTPTFFLDELASWLGLFFDETWPTEKRRQLLSEAIELYGRRGTARGLSRTLEIYTGIKPHIFEPEDLPHYFNVVLYLAPGQQVNRAALERIIQANKPAHTTYTLRSFSLKQEEETREVKPYD